MLRNLPEKSRDQRIREAFDAVGGGMSTALFARHCVDDGIWSTDELDSFILRSAQAEVRRALKKPDAAGLPFAGQTATTDEEGSPLWQMRFQWTFADYQLNVHDLLVQSDSLHRMASDLAAECANKFGRLPDMTIPADEEEESA